ncbi:TonB-dependent receptor domain-containing protein [Hymenobacter ruricola]|uniref:TonB-dependent receptor n=1 Tax=Hymenobacter ruricola TaxID=2791023 RepID=A0ABS0I9P9_9BACT|nr:TonB-dependent receptor [Hymenobacter ruricola]MBF9223689.1 TonB-dependent receptor [Hymenobacter ruricola]
MKRNVPATAVLLTALLGASSVASAQQTPGSGQRPAATAPASPRAAAGRVSGTVTDAATGKPVSYASVAVLDAAGTPVNGGVCGDDGKFVLPGIPAGTYKVQVSFVGYKNEERPGVVVTAGAATDLGTVKLEVSAQKLGEVVVTAQKPLIEERVDRTVYNAENDQTARGGDATDVLKRVPLLSVDLDGNVSLRGSSNIRVLINNKPSAIAANSIADALRQIPAEQIKTVEVITSPSAKYDAEGSGGIINIITKTNNLSGGTLGIDASVGTRSSNINLNGSLRTGKMGFSLNAGGRAGYNIPGSFTNEQTVRTLAQSYRDPVTGVVTNIPASSYSTLQSADTKQNQGFGRSVLGWDYDIDPHNSLQASLSYGARRSNNDQSRLTTISTSSQGNSVRDVSVVDNSGTVDASLNYTHTFEKPQQEFSILTLYSRNDRTNDFTNTVLNSDFSTASRLRNDNPSANEEFTVQADYQSPIGKTQVLEFGAKDILRRVNSDYSYLEAQGENGAFVPRPGVTLNNGFNYRQNVAAGYVAYTMSLPKGFTLKPGVRYEYTTISADFKDGKAVDIPDYGVLVPSVNFSRKLANGNVVKLAYNRRIQRPSLQFLNPNRQQSNPLVYTEGNPNLEPEYTNNYELGYSTLVKKVNLNLSAFARNTTGSIQSVRTPDVDANNVPTGIQRVGYANIGNEDAYGASVFASVNSGKFNLNGGVDTYYAVLKNNVSDAFYNASNQGLVASGRLFGSYKFTDVWALQAFGFYRGRQVQLQGEQSGFGFYGLSVRRDFADKKGSFGLGAQNFFTNSINIRNTIASPLLDQTSVNVLHNLSFQVNFSYRIGKLTAGPTRRGKSINNDDLKGDGGGGGGADLSGGGGAGGGAPAGGGGGAPAGGGRPGGYPGGARPAGAPGAAPAGGQRPGGYPGGMQRPMTSDSTSGKTPADSTGRPANGQQPAGRPSLQQPTAQPADSTGRQPAAPVGSPLNSPANVPSPGTSTPNGTVPAGSPGGRP